MQNINAVNIAYFIVKEYENSGSRISVQKLMKLLYFVNVWSVVSKNNALNLFLIKTKAGPFIREVSTIFKDYETKRELPLLNGASKLNSNDKKFIDFILSSYGKFNDLTLFSMIKQDAPWKKTAFGKVIEKEKIYDYYSKLSFAKNFPIHRRKKFYPVETDLYYSFIMDFDNDSNASSIVYSSLNEYLKFEKNAEMEFNKNFGKWFDK